MFEKGNEMVKMRGLGNFRNDPHFHDEIEMKFQPALRSQNALLF